MKKKCLHVLSLILVIFSANSFASSDIKYLSCTLEEITTFDNGKQNKEVISPRQANARTQLDIPVTISDTELQFDELNIYNQPYKYLNTQQNIDIYKNSYNHVLERDISYCYDTQSNIIYEEIRTYTKEQKVNGNLSPIEQLKILTNKQSEKHSNILTLQKVYKYKCTVRNQTIQEKYNKIKNSLKKFVDL